MFARLATGFWSDENHAFSPMIITMAVALACIAARRGRIVTGRQDHAWPLLAFGALLAALGSAVSNDFLLFISMVTVISALIALLVGWPAVRRFGYAVAALVFAAPLPGALLVSLTFSLKLGVSEAAAALLQMFGLPVAREGVMLDIGDYRLLVADACSGLQSMFSLIAAAIFYIALVDHRSPTRIAILMVAVLPIAFCANVLRVMMLGLLTYGFGDDAGQSYLHGLAGISLFVFAFLLLMALDRLLDVVGHH